MNWRIGYAWTHLGLSLSHHSPDQAQFINPRCA